MLIESIYKKLKEDDICDFVFEADIVERLSFKDEIVHTIQDVRSATFYACGLAQQKNSSVALFIRKEYLPSTHTGLTEAWFQNRHIIVIAFGLDILNDDLSYLKSCTCSRLKIQTIADVMRFVKGDSKNTLPELFLVEEEIDSEKQIVLEESIDLNCMQSIPDKVFLYERLSNLFKKHPNIVTISEGDKYGSISKYMGFCVASEKLNLLIIDDSVFFLDVNILNNRYMNEKFKVMVIGNIKKPNIFSWLDANHISYFEESSPLRAINKLVERKIPTVAFVKV